VKVIYLSGIDGCGKTTQAKLLVSGLLDRGISAEYQWFRWEPTFRKFIKAFRTSKGKTILNKIDMRVESENTEHNKWLTFKRSIFSNSFLRWFWLFYACCDYFIAYKKRIKKLTADVVVFDRYVDDFIIDQAINMNIAPKQTEVITNNFFLRKFHFPDYAVIIDLPAKEGYNRKNDGTPLSYLEARESYYKAMSGPDILHLNGLESIDLLAQKITEWVTQRIEGVGL
jgi:thymidylate kinase